MGTWTGVCAALALGLVFGAVGDGARAQSCAADLPAICLQSLGAGAVAAGRTDPSDCAARLQGYRVCIADLAASGAAQAAAGPEYTRAERGFLAALEAELADNVGRLDAFADGLDLTGATAVYENDWPELRLRFFNATDNPAYFAAPADWLAETQGFYDEVARFLGRADVRNAYRRQVTSVLYERRLAKEALQALVAQGRDSLLPRISAELTTP